VSDFVTKDSGERAEYSSGMRRDSANKTLRPDLIDQTLLGRWAELMGRGAIKYGERNWTKAKTLEEYDRFRASAYRHFFQWYNGIDPAEDHAAAVCFNLGGAERVRNKLLARDIHGPAESPQYPVVDEHDTGEWIGQ
jgi:hypothetical protein